MNNTHSISSESSLGQTNNQLCNQNRFSIYEMVTQNFSIKIANTLSERKSVFQLGYQVYLAKGFIKSNTTKLLTYPYDADPESTILMVQDSHQNAIASITLVFNASSILPAEKIYKDEIKYLKNSGKKLLELCRLIIAPEYRNSREIIILLFNYLAIYAYYIKNYDSLVIEVNPNHKNYYKKLIKFDEIGSEKSCPQVQGQPGVLLHLPLKRFHAETQRRAFFSNKRQKSRTFQYFINPQHVDAIIKNLTKQSIAISEEEIRYFGLTENKLSFEVAV